MQPNKPLPASLQLEFIKKKKPKMVIEKQNRQSELLTSMERNSRGTEAIVYESKIQKTAELYSLCPLFSFETGDC